MTLRSKLEFKPVRISNALGTSKHYTVWQGTTHLGLVESYDYEYAIISLRSFSRHTVTRWGFRPAEGPTDQHPRTGCYTTRREAAEALFKVMMKDAKGAG